MLTPSDLENHLMSVDAQMGALIDALTVAENQAAEATYEYELAYHTEWARQRDQDSKLAVEKIKAAAELAAIEPRHRVLVADAAVRALRSKRDLLMSRATVAQTLGKWVAAEAGLMRR